MLHCKSVIVYLLSVAVLHSHQPAAVLVALTGCSFSAALVCAGNVQCINQGLKSFG